MSPDEKAREIATEIVLEHRAVGRNDELIRSIIRALREAERRGYERGIEDAAIQASLCGRTKGEYGKWYPAQVRSSRQVAKAIRALADENGGE